MREKILSPKQRKKVWKFNLSYVYVNAIIRVYFGRKLRAKESKRHNNEIEWKCESLDNLLLFGNSRLSYVCAKDEE